MRKRNFYFGRDSELSCETNVSFDHIGLLQTEIKGFFDNRLLCALRETKSYQVHIAGYLSF